MLVAATVSDILSPNPYDLCLLGLLSECEQPLLEQGRGDGPWVEVADLDETELVMGFPWHLERVVQHGSHWCEGDLVQAGTQLRMTDLHEFLGEFLA
ncbi:hypothetical protein OG946_17165 [Streptomyces sp. NBC_01808]|nr:hypothetical protein [Streptomyces sp. NBC_01808]WSA38945.1 hypothetical protein OG946_17165 [Streptomyces sp. NBC_01808]